MSQIQTIVDGFIDLEGQSLACTLTTSILAITGLLAFIVGWILSDLKYTVYVGLSGTALAFLAVVPPWPMYNKNPLTWVSATGGKAETKKER